MRKKIGIILMSIGAVLLAGALSLLVYNMIEDNKAGESVAEIMPQMLAELETKEPAKLPTTKIESPAEEYVYEIVEEDDGEMTEVSIDGFDYIGYLSIPVLGLELPVMSEWDYGRLKIAPCRYTGSTKTDDLVIVAHNYMKHFGTLKNLEPGDILTFTDMDGVDITYTVELVETLQPTQISELVNSGYDLTLCTCTYGGKTRVTVRCDRAEG